MTVIKITCDEKFCGEEIRDTSKSVTVRGYAPRNASGILLPECHKQHDFCSHACFVEWMKWALDHE